jgi:hypothetical protein
VVAEASGHDIQVERPERFIEAVRRVTASAAINP